MNQLTSTQEAKLDRVSLDAMRHDPVTQVVEGHHVVISEQRTRLYPVRIRYCWPSELDVMARLAGLVLENRFATYDRHRLRQPREVTCRSNARMPSQSEGPVRLVVGDPGRILDDFV